MEIDKALPTPPPAACAPRVPGRAVPGFYKIVESKYYYEVHHP